MELVDFLGPWWLSREILQADGTRGRFEGRAEWQAAGADALYVEEGELVLPHGSFRAERRYRWDADLNVFFEDGRYFHTVPVAGGATGHWCDPDRYDVTYDFSRWPDWSSRWQVRGPRKDYAMFSRYGRDRAPLHGGDGGGMPRAR